MSRRGLIALAIAAVLLLTALAAWWWLRDDGHDSTGDGATDGATGVPRAVELYFPGPEAMLVAERREVEMGEEPQARLDSLARALVEGPRRQDLFAPLPQGVSVRSVSLADGGLVFIDLVSEDGGPPPSGGSTEERLRVYSLIDTLVLNVDEARSAVLLWNGAQPETLSGHLDLTRPLLPDRSLIAGGGNGGNGAAGDGSDD